MASRVEWNPYLEKIHNIFLMSAQVWVSGNQVFLSCVFHKGNNKTWITAYYQEDSVCYVYTSCQYLSLDTLRERVEWDNFVVIFWQNLTTRPDKNVFVQHHTNWVFKIDNCRESVFFSPAVSRLKQMTFDHVHWQFSQVKSILTFWCMKFKYFIRTQGELFQL